MATPNLPALQLSVPSRPTFACVRCAERKVKCDRQRPCGACVRHKVDCVFQPPRPPRKRHNHAREQLLNDRLKYYESLLQKQGVDLGKPAEHATLDPSPRRGSSPAAAPLPSNDTSEPHSSTEHNATGIISQAQIINGRGRSLFVDNSLWSRVAEELKDSRPASESDSENSVADQTSDDDFDYVLCMPLKPNAKLRHPSPKQILMLWDVFVENIDPLTKALHVPTMGRLIKQASIDTETIPRALEALMFAIYSTSVVSLDDGACNQRLGEPRAALLARYIAATKLALSRAKFMSTTSLSVLQALVLHLLSIRDSYEPRAIWSLCGVALRIAQSMGLDRDGLSLGLSPFETEMRRRVWWLLKVHDYHVAELCGLSKFRHIDLPTEGTKWPSNVNDDQLHPGMTIWPAEPEALTDVAFVAMRCELASFANNRVATFRKQGKCPDDWERYLASEPDRMESETLMMEMKARLETRYLRYCDPSQPLHLITMLLARSAINTVTFLTHHPRRWPSLSQAPTEERRLVWEVCINLLEQHNMLQSNPQLKRFAWQASSVMQWHAFIHILDILHTEPFTMNADKAWKLVGSTYMSNRAMIFDTRKPVHVAVASLCLRAYDARLALVSPHNDISQMELPEFIVLLRQQRDSARARRQLRKTRQNPESTGIPMDQTISGFSVLDEGVRQTRKIGLSDEVAHHSTSSQAGNDVHGTSQLWGFPSLEGNQASSDYAGMDFDSTPLSMVPGDNNWIGNSTVTWDQWDSWLAESNAMDPFPIY